MIKRTTPNKAFAKSHRGASLCNWLCCPYYSNQQHEVSFLSPTSPNREKSIKLQTISTGRDVDDRPLQTAFQTPRNPESVPRSPSLKINSLSSTTDKTGSYKLETGVIEGDFGENPLQRLKKRCKNGLGGIGRSSKSSLTGIRFVYRGQLQNKRERQANDFRVGGLEDNQRGRGGSKKEGRWEQIIKYKKEYREFLEECTQLQQREKEYEFLLHQYQQLQQQKLSNKQSMEAELNRQAQMKDQLQQAARLRSNEINQLRQLIKEVLSGRQGKDMININ